MNMSREMKYSNPVPFSDEKRHTNPDPFIMRWCGSYYCYATDTLGVKVSVSEDLVHWTDKGYALQQEEYIEYWAPSVFYSNGKFYMYYSNMHKEEKDEHGIWMKLAVSEDPLGPFEWKKTFFDKFSIDSHPIVWDEKLYMFYSVNDWIGADEKVAGTVILLDEMLSPEEFAGNPKPVVIPSIEQEIFAKNRFGDGRDWYTIEGAATVLHGNECFMTYSANAYVNVDYFVGTAVAAKKDDIMEMVWEKYPSPYEWYPLLKKNEVVEGTGHNTITKAPNMVDDWIVYHGRKAEEELIQGVEQREMRIDPLYFNGSQLICEGPSQAIKDAPKMAAVSKKNLEISTQTMLADIGKYYLAEYWISAEKKHIGCKYDLYLSYQDEDNYLKLQMQSGKQRVDVVCCKNGIQVVIASKELAKKYDYSVPHMISVKRMKNNYEVMLDEMYSLKFMTEEGNLEDEKLGIKPYFTNLTLHSFAVTETMELWNNKLIYISENYKVKNAVVSELGLSGKDEALKLVSQIISGDFVEEIQLETLANKNRLMIKHGTKEYLFEDKMTGRYSIYRIVNNKNEEIIVDGEHLINIEKCEKDDYALVLENIKIVGYQFTKN